MNDSGEGCFYFLMAVVAMFTIGCFVGRGCGVDSAKTEAVKAGAAEWVAGESGEAEFRWRTE